MSHDVRRRLLTSSPFTVMSEYVRAYVSACVRVCVCACISACVRALLLIIDEMDCNILTTLLQSLVCIIPMLVQTCVDIPYESIVLLSYKNKLHAVSYLVLRLSIRSYSAAFGTT